MWQCPTELWFLWFHPVIWGNMDGSMLRLARIFRDAGVVENLHGRRRAELAIILQHPDNLLVPRHFDELRFAVATARADDGVAVGQPRAGLRIEVAEFLRQIFRHERPDEFFVRCDFDLRATRFAGDE